MRAGFAGRTAAAAPRERPRPAAPLAQTSPARASPARPPARAAAAPAQQRSRTSNGGRERRGPGEPGSRCPSPAQVSGARFARSSRHAFSVAQPLRVTSSWASPASSASDPKRAGSPRRAPSPGASPGAALSAPLPDAALPGAASAPRPCPRGLVGTASTERGLVRAPCPARPCSLPLLGAVLARALARRRHLSSSKRPAPRRAPCLRPAARRPTRAARRGRLPARRGIGLDDRPARRAEVFARGALHVLPGHREAAREPPFRWAASSKRSLVLAERPRSRARVREARQERRPKQPARPRHFALRGPAVASARISPSISSDVADPGVLGEPHVDGEADRPAVAVDRDLHRPRRPPCS